jgi:uncharacterized membrane protein YhaH (DUF805 family)
MSFGDAVKTCFTKYVDFQGRASRPEYWWFFLSYVLVYVVLGIIAVAAKAPILLLVLLVYLLPLLSAAVRRLHDTGRSGWWYFIGLVPFVGFIILIVFLATEGQAGPNQYGGPPGGAALAAGGPPPPPPPPV